MVELSLTFPKMSFCHTFSPISAKSRIQISRGTGIQRRVESKSLIPRNWQSFLLLNENKSELFGFLADQAMTNYTAKVVITSKGSDVLSLQNHIIDMLFLGNHEEADSRLLLHVADAVYPGIEKVLVPITDTNVVVLDVLYGAETWWCPTLDLAWNR